MQDNLEEIIRDALVVNKDNLIKNIKLIIPSIHKAIDASKEDILNANKIDIKNKNGFKIDFEVINNIFNNLEKEDTYYGDVKLSQRDKDKKITYGIQVMDQGNVVVIDEGNTYVLIEMAIRNIIAGNTTIYSNRGYMFGTNNLLIQIIQSVLEKLNLDKNMIQIYITEEFDKLLSNFANIDLVVCIGNHTLQNEIISKSKNKTIFSGFDNYEIYIEDTNHLDFLNKVINTGVDIQLYINEDTNLDEADAILVSDIEEAIARINYEGSRCASAIFTSDTNNASKFIKEIKSNIVTVNTSPTIERVLDIKQKDLVNEKTIIYPFGFKITEEINNK